MRALGLSVLLCPRKPTPSESSDRHFLQGVHSEHTPRYRSYCCILYKEGQGRTLLKEVEALYEAGSLRVLLPPVKLDTLRTADKSGLR